MSADEREALAATWLAREDRQLSDREQAGLEEWLNESSLNRVAYLRLKASWRRADRLAALKSPDLRVAHWEAGSGSRWRPAMAVAAGLALLLGAGAYLEHRPDTASTYATTVGHRQDVRLADGTRIELNTNTKVRTEVTRTTRTVTLESGEAYFDVVHDEKRPFTVYAGNRRITDLGTKFSVFRNGDDVRVVVSEGRVRVDVLGKPMVGTPVLAEGGRAVMSRGAETLVVAKSPQDITDDLSWRHGMLVFNQQTLAEAADQFNRYNPRQILVEGNARKIRIGGSFKVDNVDGFTFLLHQGFGLSVSDRGQTIVVSR